MIIGLTGRKGSGKDTAAKVFEDHGYVNLKLAGALKAMLSALLTHQGVDGATIHRMLEGDLKETPSDYLAGHTPRYAMQTLGTEWGRNLMAEDFWVGAFTRAAAQHSKVICSDVRFHNEAQVMDQVYRIVRADVANDDPHPSEAEIDSLRVTGEIPNQATSAEEFQSRLDLMFF